jgi:glycosyltransferase involved in cell wall biosynthesis
MALTDVVEALAARRTARGTTAAAIVYSSITAALLQPARAPAAIRFDGLAALNRPGVGGAWQRRRERPVLARADLLLPWSEAAQAAAADILGPLAPASIVLPPPVASTPAATDAPEVLAYAANPEKRGLGLLCDAWRAAAPSGARLGIGGLEREVGLRWLERLGSSEPPRVQWLGDVDSERWLAMVAAARLFVNASRFEDWGLAQMEALAAGTPLVTVPTPGPNAALPLARRLAPELVAAGSAPEELARALQAGLALDLGARAAYAARSRELLAPYRDEALRKRVAEEVLPRLLSSSSS